MKEYVIHELTLDIRQSEAQLPALAAKKLGIRPAEVEAWAIVRKSLDARKKERLVYKYSLRIAAPKAEAGRILQRGAQPYAPPQVEPPVQGNAPLHGRPVVVGAGPCGLFAAYMLAKQGYQPLLLERGKAMEGRAADFEALQQQGILDPESNVCFGEGGAGAFSDGKLTARGKDPRSALVSDIFIAHGADPEIAYHAKPHLGTDHIRRIVVSMREEILRLGGEVLFGAKLTGIEQADGTLQGIRYTRSGVSTRVETNACVLAIGHSARDTFAMLAEAGLLLQPKPFAMGVRIEHPRELIDARQHGKFAPMLGAAEYAVKAQVAGRGVYSFCMCPGGEVVCSATEPGHTAVNGMSWHARDGAFSNSALVVSVGCEDMPAGPLGGIALQRRLEQAAFGAAGGYGAPAQSYRDFLAGRVSGKLPQVTYRPYVKGADFNTILPGYIRDGLAGAAKRFDGAIPGFIDKGVLMGVETRTSSPVRMVRDESLCSGIRGLYPGGEGAGYAGGIMSAAVDGVRLAYSIVGTFAPPRI